MKKNVVNVILFIMVVLLIMPHGAIQTEAAGNDIGVSMTASPSQSIVVKPVDSNAQARIDMKMTPFGKYDQLARKPVDVVFIFDTSGSMNESGNRPQKFQSAKDAMYKALDYFKQNAGPNDRFAFIPFNTTVDTNNVVQLTKKSDATFSMIRSKVSNVYALGGTNYRDPMELAQQMLNGSANDKNIIFMTDGHLTASNEIVEYESKCVKYRWGGCEEREYDYSKPIKEAVHFYENGVFVQYNNSNGYYLSGIYDENNNFRLANNKSARLSLIQYIKDRAKKTAQQIGSNQTKMYSIGFGNNQTELDQGYLEELSSVTGAYASRASEGNVDKIFLDIAESISKQKLDAEVTIDLAKFGGKVTVAEGANAAVDGTKVTMRKSFEYEYLQNAPAPVDLTLPLEFSAVGTYTFDNINLTYKRPDGSTASVTIPSVTIQVAAEAPPAINGSMVLKGESEANPVNNLIKQAGAKTNYFSAEYSLRPNGLSNSTVRGTLNNIKLIQPLPDGISLDDESASNVQVRPSANGGKEAVITLNQTISYANGAFTPASFTASLKLKADWALNNVTMPQARVEYQDTRFNQTYSSSIPSASERITSKVRLDDGNNYYYDGYANGTIKKVEKSTGKTVAETTFPNDYGLLPKPVKDIVFTGADKKAITITYSDNTTATLYFTADIGLTGVTSKNMIANGSTVYENVDAKLSQLVAGEGVRYEYRISTQEGVAWKISEWISLGKDQSVPLTTLGTNKIEVRSFGGFSLSSEEIVSKQVTIQKKAERIEIWSTGDNPQKIDQISVAEGSAVEFEVKVFPEDATDPSWKVDVTSGGEFAGAQKKSDKKEEMIGTVFGVKEGASEFTVTSNSNPGAKITIPVTVTSDFVQLEGVAFDQAKYTNKQNELVDNLLDITPSDATEPDVTNVEAATDGVVTITEDANGDWYIESDESGKGYTDVTATVTQEQPDGSTVTKQATAVFETGSDNGGESADSIDGRW
ncbi:VWA domain-containing protein [Domibacillus sp. A3M-37]|uniref:vWA domain-containing protein n=1 Tax=Domibacillus sp. A3M-37 TaxID=2962037 RepID=UPI0020B6910A|nr:vWA domain-containing protein [Domibacillus sp. A3M-37]MCP3762571.1 VWA domain-containing protein [Domibacillus sp. A3M-37]